MIGGLAAAGCAALLSSGACGRCGGEKGGASGGAGAGDPRVEVIGAEARGGRCHYIVAFTPKRDVRQARVRLPGVAPAGQGFGAVRKGERRILPVPAAREGPCQRGVTARVTGVKAGKPDPGASASFGAVGWRALPLRRPRSGNRCLVLTALRVRRPGPLGPVVTVFDDEGRALASRAKGHACEGVFLPRARPRAVGPVRDGAPVARGGTARGSARRSARGRRAYCATPLPVACDRIARVAVTRGGEARPGRLQQSRHVIEECRPGGPGVARLRYAGAAPVWLGEPSARAFLLDSKGVIRSYAPRVSRAGRGQVVLHANLDDPCVEATVAVFQRVAATPSRRRARARGASLGDRRSPPPR